jgi:hypothetical protein
MIALRLVRLIEEHSDQLSQELLNRFRNSPMTRDMAKVPSHELRERTNEILHNLGDWLLHKREAEVEQRYRTLGVRRASQDVSLSDFCWALVLTKEHIWEFLEGQGLLRGPLELYGEMELLRLLDQFFDHAICYAAEGFEQARADAVASTVNSSHRHGQETRA